MSYRIIAQDVSSGEFLNWHVPLRDVSVTYALSGANEIKGTLEPEIPELNLSAYDSWATWLHLEQDGYIRASGILQPLSLDGVSVDVVATGFSDYARGIPFQGERSGIQVDPLNEARAIWDHIQSYPEGDLGVTLDDTTSSVRIGEPEHEEPDGQGGTRTVDAQPYKLVWWEAKDCGSEFDNLARETPFDYREVSTWNADKTDVKHHIRLGYPRLGGKRQLRFAQGENVTNAIPLTELDDQYASTVIVLGAGEGRERIRATASERSDRLRRAVVIDDKDIKPHRRAKRLALDELRRRRARVSMEQITVDTSHPNAQWGSFSVGDDIPVTGEFPWLGWVSIDHRITAITWSPESDSANLTLVPTDAQYYGPPLEGA